MKTSRQNIFVLIEGNTRLFIDCMAYVFCLLLSLFLLLLLLLVLLLLVVVVAVAAAAAAAVAVVVVVVVYLGLMISVYADKKYINEKLALYLKLNI